jgi:hypothetical protein
MIPVREVFCFEVADKYVRVLTATCEYLIRTPLRQLLPRLPPGEFELVPARCWCTAKQSNQSTVKKAANST